LESKIIEAQKRALIVEIIRQIAAININCINEKIKPLVAHTNLQLKQSTKQNNSGMMHILSQFGDAEEVL
jgi:hypothetical protein